MVQIQVLSKSKMNTLRPRSCLPLLVALALGCDIGFPVNEGDDDAVEPGASPTLSSLTYEADYERWMLTVDFDWTDPQSNVREGLFYVYLDSVLHETVDLHPEDTSDATVVLYADSGEYRTSLDPFTSPVPMELGLVIEDTDGNKSPRLNHTIDLERFFFDEQDPNDTPPDAQNLGGVQLPAAIVGDLTTLGAEPNGDYNGDLDFFKFTLMPQDAGTRSFTLYWPGTLNDLGMYLTNNPTADPLVEGDVHDLMPPEEMGASLNAGEPYMIVVAGTHGGPTTYVLLID